MYWNAIKQYMMFYYIAVFFCIYKLTYVGMERDNEVRYESPKIFR
jgi:hypothetical protein